MEKIIFLYKNFNFLKPPIFMNIDNLLNIDEMNNRLFCTFTSYDNIDILIDTVKNRYTLLNNKIFILKIQGENEEFVCTYNLDHNNIKTITIPETILVHRKKQTNTLYTINALNELVKKLNGGNINPQYQINWIDYSNQILLTQSNELKHINTEIFKIFSF